MDILKKDIGSPIALLFFLLSALVLGGVLVGIITSFLAQAEGYPSLWSHDLISQHRFATQFFTLLIYPSGLVWTVIALSWYPDQIKTQPPGSVTDQVAKATGKTFVRLAFLLGLLSIIGIGLYEIVSTILLQILPYVPTHA